MNGAKVQNEASEQLCDSMGEIKKVQTLIRSIEEKADILETAGVNKEALHALGDIHVLTEMALVGLQIIHERIDDFTQSGKAV